jgi:protein-S-isoprenylcysteine O-methyltransferase Ste14
VEVEPPVPVTALCLYLGFFLAAFVWRGWIQWRRTGDHGFRGISGSVGSPEWVGGALLFVGLAAGFAAPLLEIAGVLSPVASLGGTSWRALGLVLAGSGFALTLAAQLQMGASWRVGVDRSERTELVTHGLFRFVRNPIFSAMLLALLGLALLVPNAVSLLAFVASLAGLELHVRRVEEPHLLRTHGEAYRAWASRTGRFLPGLGRLRGDVPPGLQLGGHS